MTTLRYVEFQEKELFVEVVLSERVLFNFFLSRLLTQKIKRSRVSHSGPSFEIPIQMGRDERRDTQNKRVLCLLWSRPGHTFLFYISLFTKQTQHTKSKAKDDDYNMMMMMMMLPTSYGWCSQNHTHDTHLKHYLTQETQRRWSDLKPIYQPVNQPWSNYSQWPIDPNHVITLTMCLTNMRYESVLLPNLNHLVSTVHNKA